MKFRWYSLINRALIWTTTRARFRRPAGAADRPPARPAGHARSRTRRGNAITDGAPGTQAPRALLGGLAALGPFFAIDTHLPGTDPGPPWRPLRDLATPADPLRGRIGAVRGALAASSGRPAGEIPLRVAASVTHLGLVARLIAPVLAATASRCHLDMRLDGLWWQDKLGGPAPLSVPAPGDPGPGPRDHRDPPAATRATYSSTT